MNAPTANLTTPEEKTPTSEPISSYVPTEVGDMIREDAKADKRSESYIIREILKAHYAPRLAKRAKSATRLQKAAA